MQTFGHFMEHSLRPGAIFDANGTDGHRRIEHKVFALLMQHLAPINRKHSFRTDKRTSFVLTKTIGIVLNGNALGALSPSGLLQVEALLIQAFEVSSLQKNG